MNLSVSPPDAFSRERILPRFLGMTVLLFAGSMNLMAQPIQPETAYFADDGSIPNNAQPLLLYRQALPPDTPDLASAIEERFAPNGWTGSWRASVFPFHHYHSTTHEVLGVFPEANVLVSINSTADRSNTPVSKSVVITIAPSANPAEAVAELQRNVSEAAQPLASLIGLT